MRKGKLDLLCWAGLRAPQNMSHYSEVTFFQIKSWATAQTSVPWFEEHNPSLRSFDFLMICMTILSVFWGMVKCIHLGAKLQVVLPSKIQVYNVTSAVVWQWLCCWLCVDLCLHVKLVYFTIGSPNVSADSGIVCLTRWQIILCQLPTSGLNFWQECPVSQPTTLGALMAWGLFWWRAW